MSFYFFLFLLAVLSIYFGQVFGLMIHCDNCDDFKKARRYVFLVPFFKVTLFAMYAKKCARERKWKNLWKYISLGDKSILIMCSIVETLPELYREKQRIKVRNLQRRRKVSLAELAKSVLTDTQNDCAKYGLHYF